MRVLLDAEKDPSRAAARRPPGSPLERRAARGLALVLGACALACVVSGCAPLSSTPAAPSPSSPSSSSSSSSSPARPTADALPPSASLFSYPWTWLDEKGEAVTFAHWRGQPLVVSAMFTTCQATCPRTLVKLRKVYDRFRQEGLSAQFLVVSLDPATDTPEVLRRFKTSSSLPDDWRLLTGDVNQTRDLRDLLGIHAIDDGPHLMHDGRIVIFDRQGIATRSFGGWGLDEESKL
jgi:protein SCO1